MTTQNEAAERLLDWLDKAFQEPPIQPMSYRAFRPLVLDSIEGIKAAERRATVERLVNEARALMFYDTSGNEVVSVTAFEMAVGEMMKESDDVLRR